MKTARFTPDATYRRAKSLQDGLARYIGTSLRGNYKAQLELAAAVETIMKLQPLGEDDTGAADPKILSALHESCLSLFAHEITEEQLEYLSFRLASHLDSLRLGDPVPTWHGMAGRIEAPLQVMDAKTGWSRGRQRRRGTVLEFMVIDGAACPIRFPRWFPDKFLWVLAKQLGIATWSKIRYGGKRNELVGMRLVAELENSKYDPGQITFENCDVGQFTSHNKKLQGWRHKPCPLQHPWPCYECTLGAADCPEKKGMYSRSCRPLTLEVRFCGNCGEDTHFSGTECIPCRKRPQEDNSGNAAKAEG